MTVHKLLALIPLALPMTGQQFPAERLAPFVPSPQVVVERMLSAADLRPGEMVYDLGCGDGRILITAARQFKAKAVGVELSENLVKQTQEQVASLGLQNRISVVHGDMLGVDLKPADVVTLYLLTDANERLRPLLERDLRKGARVVSHDFQIRGWVPNYVDKVLATHREHSIYVYLMPPLKKR